MVIWSFLRENGRVIRVLKKLLNFDQFVLTEEFASFLEAMEKTPHNFFVTGKAGTGKSTLITHFREKTKKRVAVLAPTGLSAINVRGQTIHSFFHFPPQMITAELVAKARINDRIYKQVDMIVIDEVSMVRADLLDGIDLFLRKFGRDKNLPFGGTQIVLVGDLFQLPPVLTDEEKFIFERFYSSPYFISSKAFSTGNFFKLELSRIFRQDDEKFVEFLNRVRVGNASMEVLKTVNERVRIGHEVDRNKTVTLTTTNRVAMEINLSQLQKLPEPEFNYEATVEGDFPTKEVNLPVEWKLRLRKGARVVFVKNGGLFVNGTLGTVKLLSEEEIVVKIDESGEEVAVPVMEWQNVKYDFDEEKRIVEQKVVGRLRQFPLRLAWAITIHKSQGMTFSKVNIDFSRSPFTHGQTYVALSRCRSLKGISLSKEIYPNDVLVDERVVEYLGRC